MAMKTPLLPSFPSPWSRTLSCLAVVLLLLLGRDGGVFGQEECTTAANGHITCSSSGAPSQSQPVTRLPDPPKSFASWYDIYNCPPKPPDGYPQTWRAKDVLENWEYNATLDTMPDQIYQGLCVFDYQTDYETAMYYKYQDVPIIIQNRPEVNDCVERWHRPNYVAQMLKDDTRNYKMFSSKSPHFLYWDSQHEDAKKPDYTPPTTTQRLSYDDFVQLSQQAAAIENRTDYHYLMVEGYWSLSDPNFLWHVFDELPMFKSIGQDNEDLFQYVFDEDFQKLHCKFHHEAPQIHATMHFDHKANAIVALGGLRRVLMAHPNMCPLLQIRGYDSPSHRQSAINFSNDAELSPSLKLLEIILQPGDTLLLPSYWFHDLVSLTPDIMQCAAWSYKTMTYKHLLEECNVL